MNPWLDVLAAKVRHMYLATYRTISWQWRNTPEWQLTTTCHIYRRRALLRGGAPIRVKR